MDRSLHRFFIRPECLNSGRVSIVGQDARQIFSVLRLRPGDMITALDGTGRAIKVRIDESSSAGVTGEVIEISSLDTEPPVTLTIAQALPKGDKLEIVIQKGTELGVAKFEVVTTARTVARPPDNKVEGRLARWQGIAKEAAEQSCRAIVPEVTGIFPLKDLAARIADYDLSICLWEQEAETSVKGILNENRQAGKILIVVGPEGGFEEDEVRMLEASGARPASLGRRVLRCETAAVAAAAVVMYELDN